MSSSVQAQPQVHVPSESHAVASLLSHPEGCTYQVSYEVTTQTLYVEGHQERLEWLLVDDNSNLMLQWSQRSSKELLPFTRPVLPYAFSYLVLCTPTCVQLASRFKKAMESSGYMRSYFGSYPRSG